MPCSQQHPIGFIVLREVMRNGGICRSSVQWIYTKRFNTITQYLGRGTLDEQTAAMMKALAKSKLEKALQDNDYAQGSYAAEMEQAALLAEAKANRKQ